MDPALLASLESIKPVQCAHCGYLLQGLAAHGRCPECGEEFGAADGIVLLGWTARGHAIRERPPAIYYWLAGAWTLWLGWALIIAMLYSPRWMQIFVITLEIAAAVVPTFILLRRRAIAGTRAKPTSQVRLYPIGYGQRKGFGTVHLMHWHPDNEITLAREEEDTYRIQIDRYTKGGTQDWAGKVDMYFAADAPSATTLLTLIKQWQHATP